MFDFLLTNITELFSYLTDANKRIFALYLVSSFLLAIPAYHFAYKQKSLRHFFSYVFPKNVYFAKSAQFDYSLLVINKLLKAALFPLVILTLAPIAIAVSDALEGVFGAFKFIKLSSMKIMMIFTLLLFIADDFSRFLLHYLMHRISWLWEFHKVHHSATVLTPFTIYRSHPVESYLYACRMALSQGVVVGICYYFFGPQLKMIDILGANMFVFIFNVFGANLRHSHIWLSWGDRVENWLISPAQHQVHHSNIPRLHHKNFGSALAIWDRLFRCHVPASQVKKLTFGLNDSAIDHNSLLSIYFQPFKLLYLKMKGNNKRAQ